jgi:predicted ATP-grasp superfamily ATP-dependent carboligase
LVALAASVCGFIPVERKVWVTGTSSELIELFSKNKNAKIFKGATISGINGLAPVVAQVGYGINGVCLLADTYPLLTEDPAASKCLLEVVRDQLLIPLDTSLLDGRIKKMQEELVKIEGELTRASSKSGKGAKPPDYFG